jgi:UDP-N-acetylmuramate dehydrogenase
MAEARVGGARLDPRHANFLTNANNAGSADIIELALKVRDAVREKLGVELHTEVRYVSPEGVQDLC